MQLPIGAEDHFEGVVDLLKMKAIQWDMESQGMKFEYIEIPANLVEKAKKAREHMVESAAETSEELMNKYLEGGELSEEEVISGIRDGTVANKMIPVFCGSAFKNKGVQAMLDGVIPICRRRRIVRRSRASTRTTRKIRARPATTSRSRRSRSRSRLTRMSAR